MQSVCQRHVVAWPSGPTVPLPRAQEERGANRVGLLSGLHLVAQTQTTLVPGLLLAASLLGGEVRCRSTSFLPYGPLRRTPIWR